MLRDKHKNVSVVEPAPDTKKSDKKSHHHHNCDSIFAHCTGSVKYPKECAVSVTSPAKEKDSHHKKSSKNGGVGSNSIFKKCDKNQLLKPNSVFDADRRSSFSDYTTEQRRASYDRYSCNCSMTSLGGPERRASYDVSYGASSGNVKTASNCNLHPNEEYKPERRGSLVQRWFNRISEAADAYSKAKENKHKSRSSDVSNVPLHDLDSEIDQVNQFAKTKENEHGGVSDTANLPPSINAPSSQDDSGHGNDAAARKSGTSGGGISPGQRRKGAVNAERKRLPENLLIEPSQVSVFERTVHTAEAVLTPLERLRRKDELIREALQEKQKLVADILHVPKDEFETISDLATEPAYNKEASELVLAAVNQADQLTSILNECLRVTEEDTVAASAEVLVSSSTSCSSATTAAGGKSPTRTFPPLPVPRIQSISSVLSANLTQLFAVITNHEEEREKWRQELQKYREEVHRMHELQQLQQQRVDEQNSASSATTPAPAPATVVEGDVSPSVTSSASTTEDHNKSPSTTGDTNAAAAAANGADSVQNEKK